MLQVRCAQPILARRLYDVCVEHTQFYEETKVDTKRLLSRRTKRVIIKENLGKQLYDRSKLKKNLELVG